MKKIVIMAAAAITLAAVPYCSAQSAGAGVMFSWGGTHTPASDSIAINFSLNDRGPALTLPVELTLSDRDGNVVYKNTMMVSSGHTRTFVITMDERTARTTIPGDVYAVVNTRFLIPAVRVVFPTDPNMPSLDRMTLSLELFDLATGRVKSFVDGSHAVLGMF